MAPDHTTVVCYVRASTEKQETSCADQLAELQAWAASRGLAVAEVFTDDGVSGSDLARPGLTDLLAYVEARPEGGLVLLWETSRLVRALNPDDAVVLRRRIERAGWQIEALHGSAPSTGDAGMDGLMRYVQEIQHGQALKDTAVRTLRGMKAAFTEGRSASQKTPFGYAKQITSEDGTTRVVPRGIRHRKAKGERARLVPGDPAEVEAVRRLFTGYDAGQTMRELAAELNAAGAPSASGGRWSPSAVRAILRRDEYAGALVWGRTSRGKVACVGADGPVLREERLRGREVPNAADVVLRREGAHEPLVSRNLLERVQRRMDETGRGKGPVGRRSRQVRPLTAILHCSCGSPMIACRDRYVCSSGDKGGGCVRYSVPGDLVHRAVLGRLRRAYAPLRASKRMRDRIARHVREAMAAEGLLDDGGGKLRIERDALRAKVAQALENLAEVPASVARQLGAQVEEWQGRLAAVEAELAQCRERAGPDPKALTARALDLLEGLDRVDADANREELRRLFERCVGRVVLEFGSERVPAAGGRGGRPVYPPIGGNVELAGLAAELAFVGQRSRSDPNGYDIEILEAAS